MMANSTNVVPFRATPCAETPLGDDRHAMIRSMVDDLQLVAHWHPAGLVAIAGFIRRFAGPLRRHSQQPVGQA